MLLSLLILEEWGCSPGLRRVTRSNAESACSAHYTLQERIQPVQSRMHAQKLLCCLVYGRNLC